MEEHKIRIEHSTPEKMFSYSDKFFSTSPKEAMLFIKKSGLSKAKVEGIVGQFDDEDDKFIDETSIPDEDEMEEDS
jgi:hypothetical protein